MEKMEKIRTKHSTFTVEKENLVDQYKVRYIIRHSEGLTRILEFPIDWDKYQTIPIVDRTCSIIAGAEDYLVTELLQHVAPKIAAYAIDEFRNSSVEDNDAYNNGLRDGIAERVGILYEPKKQSDEIETRREDSESYKINPIFKENDGKV